MKNLNVLLIEDEYIAQIIAKHIITKCGANVDIVNNIQDTLNLLAVKEYDLIFMDLNLSGVLCIELVNKLVHDIKVKTPIIAITAFNFENIKEQFTKNCFNDFIKKPLTAKEFKKVINRLLIKN